MVSITVPDRRAAAGSRARHSPSGGPPLPWEGAGRSRRRTPTREPTMPHADDARPFAVEEVRPPVAVGAEGKLLDAEGNPPHLTPILLVDSAAAIAGGLGSVSSNTSYVESAAGVGEGARTGLASVVTGAAFLVDALPPARPRHQVEERDQARRQIQRDRHALL